MVSSIATDLSRAYEWVKERVQWGDQKSPKATQGKNAPRTVPGKSENGLKGVKGLPDVRFVSPKIETQGTICGRTIHVNNSKEHSNWIRMPERVEGGNASYYDGSEIHHEYTLGLKIDGGRQLNNLEIAYLNGQGKEVNLRNFDALSSGPDGVAKFPIALRRDSVFGQKTFIAYFSNPEESSVNSAANACYFSIVNTSKDPFLFRMINPPYHGTSSHENNDQSGVCYERSVVLHERSE